jgi:hypothetical protein
VVLLVLAWAPSPPGRTASAALAWQGACRAGGGVLWWSGCWWWSGVLLASGLWEGLLAHPRAWAGPANPPL